MFGLDAAGEIGLASLLLPIVLSLPSLVSAWRKNLAEDADDRLDADESSFAREMYEAQMENADRLQETINIRDRVINELRAEVDRLWRENLDLRRQVHEQGKTVP